MLKVFFAGSPQCAVPALETAAERAQVVGVLTSPPTARKRSAALIPSDVASAAERLKAQGKIAGDAPVLAPPKIDDEARAQIAHLKPDILLCFAYGKIFSEKTLSLFPKGAFNIHPSLLPRWRGPSPVQATILNMDREAGVTIQAITAQMDAGDIAAQAAVPLDGTETAAALLERLSSMGARLLPSVLEQIEAGSLRCRPQEGEALYCHLIEKKEGEIDWSRSAEEIDAKVRAFSPWPGAFTKLPQGRGVLYIRKASVYGGEAAFPDGRAGAVQVSKSGIYVRCGRGILSVERLQREARPEMDFKAFLNGNRAALPERFGE